MIELANVRTRGEELNPKDFVSNALDSWKVSTKKDLKRVLLIPPDITRLHSGAGSIANQFFKQLNASCQVKVLPALGTHEPMTAEEVSLMFKDIPYSSFVHHNWKTEVDKVGKIPGQFIEENSGGWCNNALEIKVNRILLEPWDLIVSIGQVVPHEVAGMANYTKNIVIGCGGKEVIDHSHMLSAKYGIERTLGVADNPVRRLLDYAEENIIAPKFPLLYVLSVTSQHEAETCLEGLFAGTTRGTFESAAKLSEEKNIFKLPSPLQKVVVNLDGKKFKSTWLGNKAIYRTRMALADDAELLVLAPGIRKFGEDDDNDRLIRKLGYFGTDRVFDLLREDKELASNLSVAAHLIHGSSEGRFKITYAVDQLSKEEIESVGYNYASYQEERERFFPEHLTEAKSLNTFPDGFREAKDGESFYYISNPAVALWKT